MNKGNYLFLGLGISYVIVAIIQWFSSGALSATLYVTVAFISFELTLLELIKSVANLYYTCHSNYEKTRNNYIDLLKRNISVFKAHSALDSDTELLENKLQEVQNNSKVEKYRKRKQIIKKTVDCVTILQIIFCTIQIIVTPLKIIPYDLLTSKTINSLSLLSFAFMFLSYFVSSCKTIEDQVTEKLDIESHTTDYFVDIIEKINSEEKSC